MPERYRQLLVKDLPKVLTWRLGWDSNLRPFGRKALNLTTELPHPSSDSSWSYSEPTGSVVAIPLLPIVYAPHFHFFPTGPPVHMSFPADLPVRLFSPASGSESNLSAGPSGHSSPGLSPAPPHTGVVPGGPFSPQIKSEHGLRKASSGPASATLQQMQQGMRTARHLCWWDEDL